MISQDLGKRSLYYSVALMSALSYTVGIHVGVGLALATYYLGEHIYRTDAERANTSYTQGTGTPQSAAIMAFWDAFFPATLAFGILYTFFLVKSSLAKSRKLIVLGVMIILNIVVLAQAGKTKIFRLCNIIGCTYASPSLGGKTFGGNDEYADDYNMPASYTNSNAIVYFFTALLALPFLVFQFVRVYRFDETSKVTFMLNLDEDHIPNPLVASTGMQPSSISSSVSSASTPASVYKHVELMQSRKRWLGVFLGLVVLLPVHVILTTRLGNNFQWIFPYEVATWAAREITPATNIGWVLQYRISSDLVLKLFPDVVIFYLYIYVNSAVALLCSAYPRSRAVRTLHSFDVSSHLCNGELLFWFGFIAHIITTFCYWYLVHGWEGNPIPAVSTAERFSRTTAQVALSFLGLMVLPVSRNSLWSHVFGLGWEAMVRFHKVAARCFLVTVCIHMFSFWVVFSQKNVFPQAIFGSPNGFITDNLTIGIMSTFFIFFVLPLMGVLTLNYVRRRYFEVFYFSHFFSMVLFCATIWHAASAWYFLLPGLALWAVDHLLRFTKSCRPVAVSALRASSGAVTYLRFRVVPDVLSAPSAPASTLADATTLAHEQGQYVFVNVPEIALLEFHPFSISSSPLDDASSCHIKSMGTSTWTGRLHALAQRLEKEGGLPPTVNVDGPYGLPFAFRHHTKILLLAGGIGVTPLHSILRTLVLLSLSPEGLGKDCALQSVRLVWSVRDRSLVPLFKDTLERVKALGQNSKGVSFEVEVYSSVAATAADEAGSTTALAITQGRVNVVAEVARLAADGGASPLVYVCGPESLVREAKAAAIAKEVAFSNETFLL